MLGNEALQLESLVDPPAGLSLELLPCQLEQLADNDLIHLRVVAQLVGLSGRKRL
jgi:hypothetical protein